MSVRSTTLVLPHQRSGDTDHQETAGRRRKRRIHVCALASPFCATYALLPDLRLVEAVDGKRACWDGGPKAPGLKTPAQLTNVVNSPITFTASVTMLSAVPLEVRSPAWFTHTSPHACHAQRRQRCRSYQNAAACFLPELFERSNVPGSDASHSGGCGAGAGTGARMGGCDRSLAERCLTSQLHKHARPPS